MKRSVAIGIALAMLLLTSGCGLFGGGPITITAIMSDSAGLFRGNDVGVLGVAVGRVTKIEPEGDHVKVTMKITDPDVRIPASAGAAVVARSVATDRYVELTPVYAKGPRMEDGAQIPLSRTATPVDFDQVLASLKTFGDGLVNNPDATNSLKDLISITADNLQGTGKPLNRSVQDLAKAVNGVSGQSDNIFGTLRSLDSLTQALVDDKDTVRAFVANVAAASQLLADERYNMGAAVRTLSSAVDELAAFAKEHRIALRRDVVDFTAVMKSLNDSHKDLEETLGTLPLATDNLRRAAAENGNIRVKLDFTDLLPDVTKQVIDAVCSNVGKVCDALTVPPSLNSILGALVGGA